MASSVTEEKAQIGAGSYSRSWRPGTLGNAWFEVLSATDGVPMRLARLRAAAVNEFGLHGCPFQTSPELWHASAVLLPRPPSHGRLASAHRGVMAIRWPMIPRPVIDAAAAWSFLASLCRES